MEFKKIESWKWILIKKRYAVIQYETNREEKRVKI